MKNSQKSLNKKCKKYKIRENSKERKKKKKPEKKENQENQNTKKKIGKNIKNMLITNKKMDMYLMILWTFNQVVYMMTSKKKFRNR